MLPMEVGQDTHAHNGGDGSQGSAEQSRAKVPATPQYDAGHAAPPGLDDLSMMVEKMVGTAVPPELLRASRKLQQAHFRR